MPERDGRPTDRFLIAVFSSRSELGIGVAIDEETEIDSGPSRREFAEKFQTPACAVGGRARRGDARPGLPEPARRLWRSPMGMAATRLSVLAGKLVLSS